MSSISANKKTETGSFAPWNVLMTEKFILQLENTLCVQLFKY